MKICNVTRVVNKIGTYWECSRFCVFTVLITCLILSSCTSQSVPTRYNFNFEQIDPGNHLPSNWILYWSAQNIGYDVTVDSVIKKEGVFALSISKDKKGGVFGICQYNIPARLKGSKIRLVGYVRTENVKNGYAGLFMWIENNGVKIEYDNMKDRGIMDTHDWTRCEISLPYDAKAATSIAIGGALTGDGKMWLDDLTVYIDGENINLNDSRDSVVSKPFIIEHPENYENIQFSIKDTGKIQILTNLGILWGFLKYYHPKVENGSLNWDDELFKILPSILQTPDINSANKILENWVDNLGEIDSSYHSNWKSQDVKISFELNSIFGKNDWPSSLMAKLNRIYENHKLNGISYYYGFSKIAHNVQFTHDLVYCKDDYPPVAVRLLSLYRYWNYVQYFFPYRYRFQKSWKSVLHNNIEHFVNSKDAHDYVMDCLQLICTIEDTHADVAVNAVLDTIKGMRITPFQAKIIQNKLVVTGYYTNRDSANRKIFIGDVITKINEVPVSQLLKNYLPYTSGSNLVAKLRNVVSTQGFLLRSNNQELRLSLENKKIVHVVVKTIPIYEANVQLDWMQYPNKPAYEMIGNQIGYIYPAKFNDSSMSNILYLFYNYKGVIVDLRCYPSIPMLYDFSRWLNAKVLAFGRPSVTNSIRPGEFTMQRLIFCGEENTNNYKGKVVVLVNEMTQSQAEFTAMAFQSNPNVIVMGSQTAGADGNVSFIKLPGNIYTGFSGIGIYYPDGSETQGVGVKVDLTTTPTIEGIRQGRDEVLEKAVKYINNEKQN